MIEYWRQRIRADYGARRADGATVREYQHGLRGAAFFVGVNWQGNPRYRADRLRSFPASCFTPLATLPGVQLISLKKGAGQEPLERLHGGGYAEDAPRDGASEPELAEGSHFDVPGARSQALAIGDLGWELDESRGAFMDTAAVMMNLDLVVTSDTAIAHLAGALGRPVWVALPYAADWRWLLQRDDSPWYPTMRLYRQRTRGDWAEVFDRIKADLARLVQALR